MESKENRVNKWASRIPFGFKEFVKGMSNENRIAIASLLMSKDELRFSEIQETLGIPKNLLSQHLKVLLNYGLIRRTKSYWTDEEKVFKSNYKLNPIYRDLLKANIVQLKTHLLKHLHGDLKPTEIQKQHFEFVGIQGSNEPIIFRGEGIKSIEFLKQHFEFVGIHGSKKTILIKGEVEHGEQIWSPPDNTGEKGKWRRIN